MPDFSDHVGDLERRGFAWIRSSFGTPEEAFVAARELVDARSAKPLSLVGDFVLPPLGGTETRDFQTLHFDFGIPIDPKVAHDVGRFTALHIASDARAVSATTRLVPLGPLLSQRAWPSPPKLLDRVVDYGRTHGAWHGARGYVEGSLARLVEAAAGSPELPSVRTERGFLCGMEFDTLRSEERFFERHGLRVSDVQQEVALSAGQLLVFDNLAVAHGRRGVRRPGELRQWVFGEEALGVDAQRWVRDRILIAFNR